MALLTGTTKASTVGESTFSVVVGVSHFQDPGLRTLPAAAGEAAAIHEALVDATGCRLPPDQAILLVDRDATRVRVLDELQRCCHRARHGNTVFVYFATHGVDDGSRFALATHDFSRTDPFGTGVSSEDLQAILGTSQARGVLLILDCCGGAALAETAPGMFQGLAGGVDFRILLSSSRRGQSSWEGPDGSRFSRALLEVLDGSVRLGDAGGAIYFSDLSRHLHDSVAHDDPIRQQPRQEPIAAASFARDPLLFLHLELTLQQVDVRIQRYSRQQVSAILRRAASLTAGFVVIGGLTFWSFLAGHHYLSVQDETISLYRGHPAFRALGYPRLVWQYDVRLDELDAASPLAHGQAVVSSWNAEFGGKLLEHLNAVGKARWLIGDKKPAEARPVLDEVVADARNTAAWSKAAQMWAHIAEAADASKLEELARSDQADVATLALLRLLTVAPDAGARVATQMGYADGRRGVHLQVLADLPPACPPGVQRYLEEFATASGTSQFARLVIDASLRTGCRPSLKALGRMNQAFHLRSVAAYLELVDKETATALLPRFVKAFEAQAAEPNPEATVNLSSSAAYLISARRHGQCPQVASMDRLPRADQLSAMPAIVRQCADTSLVLETGNGTQGGFTATLLRREPTPAAQVAQVQLPASASMGDLFPLFDTYQFAPPLDPGSQAVLEGLALRHTSFEVQTRAMRTLRLAGRPANLELAPSERSGQQQLQREAYLWLATSQRNKVLARIEQRLSDETASFIPTLTFLMRLSEAERTSLLAASQAAQVSDRTRAALTGLFASPANVAMALTDPQLKYRNLVADWLPARSDLNEIAKALPSAKWHGQFDADSIKWIVDRRDALAREIAAAGPDDASWRVRLMLDLRQIRSSGFIAWLQGQCTWCD